jgi:hypothetical protein
MGSGYAARRRCCIVKSCAFLLGYARTSTDNQNLDLKVANLSNSVAPKSFDERTNGRTDERTNGRRAVPHALTKASKVAPQGRTLVVAKLNRVDRNAKIQSEWNVNRWRVRLVLTRNLGRLFTRKHPKIDSKIEFRRQRRFTVRWNPFAAAIQTGNR